MGNKRRPRRPELALQHDQAWQAAERLRAEGVTPAAWSDEPPADYPEPTLEWIMQRLDSPRVNAYHCGACNEVVVTIDKHPGATPAFVSHGQFGVECEGETTSAWYRVRQEFAVYATHEWYRPNRDKLEEWRRHAANPETPLGVPDRASITAGGMLDHVMNGGLDLRPIPENSDTIVDTLARLGDRDNGLQLIASARQAGKTRATRELQERAQAAEAHVARRTGGYRG